MARYTFGGTLAAFAISAQTDITGLYPVDSNGVGAILARLMLNAPLTLWTAPTGGTQITDLLIGGTVSATGSLSGGSATTTITTDQYGEIPLFNGPDSVKTMWIDGGTGFRRKVDASDGATAGSTGPAGPANSLAIGSVTTGAAGSPATATITGTAPSQTLSLVIPQGAAGAAGAAGTNGTDGDDGAPGPGLAPVYYRSGAFLNRPDTSATNDQAEFFGPVFPATGGALTGGNPAAAEGDFYTPTAI